MDNWNYFNHLVLWVMPIILLQWVIGWRIFLGNWQAVLFPTLLGGIFWSLADVVAVWQGIWHFDEEQILGIHLGVLPLEEVLFFFLVSWLVAQSYVLFLPEKDRHPRWGSSR
jgi:lycopene cyclase domain-containing protein